MPARTLLVHIGTHKTGTKTLQVFLVANHGQFERAGTHVVRFGRIPTPGTDRETPGNHTIPIELIEGRDRAALRGALLEVASNSSPFAILSSEEFHVLHASPALAELRSAALEAGIELRAILYLRNQAHYAEALFGEVAKATDVPPFARHVQAILERGAIVRSERYVIEFDYARLLRGLQNAFGEERVLVREYRTDRGLGYLTSDFLSAIQTAGATVPETLRMTSSHMNGGQSLAALLENFRSRASQAGLPVPPSVGTFIEDAFPGVPEALLAHRFVLLSRSDLFAFYERFFESNERVRARCGVNVNALAEAYNTSPSHPVWEIQRVHRTILDRAMEAWALP
jgi:hypothetical protein